MRSIEFHVEGIPIPQGSKSAFVNKNSGRAQIFEQQSTKLRHWRRAVRDEARRHRVTWIIQSPLEVRLSFVLPAPKRVADAMGWCATKPDIDKLTRAVLDALTDGKVLVDDAQVVRLLVTKRYGTTPGVGITIRDADHVYAPVRTDHPDEGARPDGSVGDVRQP